MPKLNVIYKRVILLTLLLVIANSNTLLANEYSEGSTRYFNEYLDINEEITEDLESELKEFAKSAEQILMDSIKAKVISNDLMVSLLDSASFKTLPIGLSSGSGATGSNPDYSIIIDKASIHPNHAEFSAFMTIKNPIDGQMVYFRADGIEFTFGGGLQNGFQLELVAQVNTKLSEDSNLTWMPGTYVKWDCNGFESLGINAKIELSEEKFQKVDVTNGKVIDGKVSTTTFITASSFNDLLIDITFDPFKLAGFDEAYFSFQNVVLDCSDTRNSSSFKIPSGYPGNYSGDKKNLWRGFFVEKAEVFFPKFRKDERVGNDITSIYADNLILDDFGLTGKIGATNILSLEEGRIATWNMSIVKLELEFFTGDFKSLTLGGGILVDGIGDPLAYNAFFDASRNYHFAATIGQELPFNAFSAEVSLAPTSRIDVEEISGEFSAAVVLDGDITFACAKKAGGTSKLVNIPYIEFQKLRIATQAPIFDIEYLALVSENEESNMNNFPISIKNVVFDKRQQNFAMVSFDLFLNLIPSGDLGISGETNIGICANIEQGNWSYAGVKLSKIKVEAEVEGAFKISGGIEFIEGDQTYGKGFRGEIDAVFAESFELNTVAVFGKVNGYRYFFIDAFYSSSTGIPAGPFTLNGFGGGLFYKMRQANGNEGSDFGKSLSDINYVPDDRVFIGIKAGLAAGVVNPAVVNAKLNFEIAFTSSMGVSMIGFDGEAVMLAPPIDIPEDAMKAMSKETASGKMPKMEPSSMKLGMKMKMDFLNDVFHSEMDLFVNISGALKGIGENNRAGYGVMHIDPDKWYLHLGTPTDPIGLNFIGLMEVSSYFMAGHDIPDAMMMNSKVLEILDMSQADFNGNRGENDLVLGKGVAFGSHFSIDTGDLTFSIFYAQFAMGGGFDIMLLDYGDAAYCEGRDGKLGIDGWFAKGQAYAYFGGKIGIKVKVFGKKKNYDIINLQAAAAIRAEGPNPTWMKGVVGGEYKILGGMIKGNCKFEVTVGEKCELRTMKDLSDLEIIADLTPSDNSDDVDIFAMPQGVFNMPVGKVLKISDDPELTKEFKIKLEEYKLYEEDGTIYPGSLEWNADKTSLAYRMDEILYSKSEYKIVAKVSFEEKVDGKWQVYEGDDGKKYIESKEAIFSTGDVPDKMPDHVVEYSYPLDRMVNFYKEEYNKSYVGFNMGVSAFFERTEGYKQQARWTQVNSNSPIYTDVTYLKDAKRVETSVPSDLVNDKIYHFELVHIPTGDLSMDSNVSETSTAVEDTETEIVTRSAEGEINDGEEKAFLAFAFRCSKYNKFLDKLPEDELNVRFLYNVSPAIDLPGATIYKDELFDQYEIGSNIHNITALIQREAVISKADWYQKTYVPMIYLNYPLHSGAKITGRELNNLGVPPTKDIDIWQVDYDYILTDSDIEGGTYNMKPEFSHFVYSLPRTWANDYAEIRNHVTNLLNANKISNTAEVGTLINTYPWPQTDSGNYPIRLSYTLPGINQVSSSKVINLKNEFDINQVNFEE